MPLSGKHTGKARVKYNLCVVTLVVVHYPQPSFSKTSCIFSFSSASNISQVKATTLFAFLSYRTFYLLSNQQWKSWCCPLKCYADETRVARPRRWISPWWLQFQTSCCKTCAIEGVGVGLKGGCIKTVVWSRGVGLPLQQKVTSRCTEPECALV